MPHLQFPCRKPAPLPDYPAAWSLLRLESESNDNHRLYIWHFIDILLQTGQCIHLVSLNPNFPNPILNAFFWNSWFKSLSVPPLRRLCAKGMKIIRTGTNPAAMRSTERNDYLSGKIITLQKCTDNSGGLPVPYRIAKQNRIIAVHILHTSWYSRACIRIVLLLIGTASRIICQIRLRIRLLCYNFINIRPKDLRRILC